MIPVPAGVKVWLATVHTAQGLSRSVTDGAGDVKA